jgi:hypothetical protein
MTGTAGRRGDLKGLELLPGMDQGYNKYSGLLWLGTVVTANIIMYVKTGLRNIMSLPKK